MIEEEIKKMNEWFEDDDRAYSTERIDDIYNVSELDMDDFFDFIKDNYPDLVGFSCMVCSDGIWFKKENLEKAEYI